MTQSDAHSAAQNCEIIALCDANDSIRFVSRSFAHCFGAPVEDWLGRSFSPGGGAAAPGRPAHYRTSARFVDGEKIVEWLETVLEGGERLYVGQVAHTDDGTVHNGNGEEFSADSKMQFLATMSHEMRTPLNGVLGMTSLLMDTALEPNQRSYAESVRESAVALLALINDLLDYSKIEAGRLELEPTPFNAASLIQGVAELLSPKAADKGIEIAAYTDFDIPPNLFGDEGRLRQVLLNLAGNGVKFTDAGGVSIEAYFVKLIEGRAQVRFEIRDTGIGVPRDMQASIFDEFSQANIGAERRREGTGLGLAIAQKIVRAMGSEITLESAPGKGSTFSFTVDLDFDPHERAEQTSLETTILIATRNPVLRRTLALQLASIGAETVLHASTGEEAMEYARHHPASIILCDIYLAGECPPNLSHITERALIMLSPLARTRIAELREAGFDGYLIKPVRQASLLEQLTENALPYAALEQAAPKKEALDMDTKKSLRVLLAEDNKINAVLATTIIKRAGHSVVVAENGEEAVATLMRENFDIILMDMHMPGVDGLEATRRIRESAGDVRTTPIIALTASAMPADRQKCLSVGMDDFLGKPFEPNDLMEILSKWGGSRSEYSKAS